MESGQGSDKCTAPAQEKHLELYSEITSVGNVLGSLQELHAKIAGEPHGDKKECAPEHQSPCLRDVLESAPRDIRENVSACHKLISEIKELLF